LKRQPPQYLFPDGAQFGTDNLILHARAKRHVVHDVAGPLSIKTVIEGEVSWKLARREVTVDSRSFLMLREGEKYSLDIDGGKAVETCCVFFQSGFAEQAMQDATTPLEASLDHPTRSAPALPFLSYLHSDTEGRLVPYIHTLARRAAGELAPSASEEAFLQAAARLLRFYKEVRAQMARLPAVKTGTREELYRRLLIAKEYVHSHRDDAVSLEAVARAACLSRYHFHRAFTETFRSTPHAYITELRLRRAHALLRQGTPVTETCMEVGFSSLSSFSRLFRGRYGTPPSGISKNGSVSRAL
jgi:AraC family transcriptional regulator